MAQHEPTKIDVPLANPAPLGLMGFGMTTVLLNLANAGYFHADTIILAMGLFYGGLAQIIAGAMEFRKGNTFGMTAFLSYGLFWESFAFLLMLPSLGLSAFAPSGASLQAYLVMWGLFTLLMFVGTIRLNGALMVVFGTLFILFFLLAAGVTNTGLTTIAGYEGVICGLSAMYTGIAEVLNEVYGKTVLPIFPRRAS
ncbi:MAG TPA: acetate uptake transporter [Nitrososphaerales archaeon]|nr:acetate uptake transporter [Nitrososphaerales archaeon]